MISAKFLIFAGNLVDWWEPSTKASYLRKASCIIEQYGNYKIPRLGLSLNGINTQGENIADNGGIKEAYRAYSEYPNQSGHISLYFTIVLVYSNQEIA